MIYIILIIAICTVLLIHYKKKKAKEEKKASIPPRDDYTDSDDEIPERPNRRYPRPFSQAWMVKNAPRKMIIRDPYGPRNGKYEEDD